MTLLTIDNITIDTDHPTPDAIRFLLKDYPGIADSIVESLESIEDYQADIQLLKEDLERETRNNEENSKHITTAKENLTSLINNKAYMYDDDLTTVLTHTIQTLDSTF